jgi:hypothetical protein
MAVEMGRACSTHENRNLRSILVGKPEGMRPLEEKNVGRIILK